MQKNLLKHMKWQSILLMHFRNMSVSYQYHCNSLGRMNFIKYIALFISHNVRCYPLTFKNPIQYSIYISDLFQRRTNSISAIIDCAMWISLRIFFTIKNIDNAKMTECRINLVMFIAIESNLSSDFDKLSTNCIYKWFDVHGKPLIVSVFVWKIANK